MGTTFVVPHYNDSQNALRCLMSIRRHLPLARIIVSDGGSSREHRLALERNGALWDELLTEQYRLYSGEARNRGWLAAQDDWVVFCDSDVELLDGSWLARHQEVLSYNLDVSIVGGWGEAWFLGPELKAYSVWDLEGWPARTRTYWNACSAPAGYCHMVNGGLVTTRRTLRETVLWERDHPRFDDVWLGAELLSRGMKAYFLPANIIHRMGGNNPYAPEDWDRSLKALLAQYGEWGSARRSLDEVRRYMVHGRW